MTYVCPHCGAKISPKSETRAAKIKGTCPVCKQVVEFVASDGIADVQFTTINSKKETNPKVSKKKKWKTAGILIFLAIGTWVGWMLYDDYQRRESYKRWAREQEYQYSDPYQPSFTGNGRRYDRLKKGTQSCNGGFGCTCKFTKASLEAQGYTECPDCGHSPKYHH